MNKKQLAKILISTWDMNKEELTRLIQFLTVCMYHADEPEKISDIQNLIWYATDKINRG